MLKKWFKNKTRKHPSSRVPILFTLIAGCSFSCESQHSPSFSFFINFQNLFCLFLPLFVGWVFLLGFLWSLFVGFFNEVRLSFAKMPTPAQICTPLIVLGKPQILLNANLPKSGRQCFGLCL